MAAVLGPGRIFTTEIENPSLLGAGQIVLTAIAALFIAEYRPFDLPPKASGSAKPLPPGPNHHCQPMVR